MFRLPPTAKRVQFHTPACANRTIQARTARQIRELKTADAERLKARLLQLDREWDTERVLETNASILILSGLLLGRKNRNWLFLSFGVSAFLLQHALQGWCPPFPVIRALGVRTPQEIESERADVLSILGQRYCFRTRYLPRGRCRRTPQREHI